MTRCWFTALGRMKSLTITSLLREAIRTGTAMESKKKNIKEDEDYGQ